MVKMPHWPLYLGPDRNIIGSVARMKKMLSFLGNPHLRLKNIIHITGTKGKGSTSVYIDAILREIGLNVNLYTSPHIYDANERFLINGIKISDEELYYYTEIVRNAFEKSNIDPISSFEAMTLTAFLKFADTNADVNVIEVGMGGLTDATNIFEENPPFACVFSTIHLDHKIFLGNSSLDIAYQKLGILKEGVKNVVSAQQSSDVLKYILENTKRFNSNSFFYGIDFEAFEIEGVEDKFLLELNHMKKEFILDNPVLIGNHQIKNLSTAIQTCLLLKSNISAENIINSYKKVVHYTRMQEIKKSDFLNILPAGSKIFVDGGHNKLAAVAILDFLKKYLESNKGIPNAHIIIARSKNVDNLDMLSVFSDKIVKKIFAIRAIEARPEPPEKILLAGLSLGIDILIESTPEECLKTIAKEDQSPCIVIFCGSLYLGRFF